MTPTLPTLGTLKPNPPWAKLPLFNRKSWSRVRFGEVVEHVNDTVSNPAEGTGLWTTPTGRFRDALGRLWDASKIAKNPQTLPWDGWYGWDG